MRFIKNQRVGLFVLVGLLVYLQMGHVHAAAMVVMEARGTAYKVGSSVDADKSISLKEGERLVLIGADGRSVTLRGPFNGKPLKGGGISNDRAKNLAALISTRDARTSAVGVVRAGATTASLPEPWLLDVAAPGDRCLLAGAPAVLWREDSSADEALSVMPQDRSWRVDLDWKKGVDRVSLPKSLNLSSLNAMVLKRGAAEVNLVIHHVPDGLPDALLTASWLTNKGCIQQADAMLKVLAAQRR